MKRIFKYRLPRDGETVTINAHVVRWLNIQSQDGWPHIWAIVDDEGYPYDYEFIAWGTGWDFPDELDHCQYMGTAIDGAGYVWHYFMQSTCFVTGLTIQDYEYDPKDWSLSTSAGCPTEPYSVTISADDWSTVYNELAEKVSNMLVTGSVAELTNLHA